MFRIDYAKLNLEQVRSAVLNGGGPVSAGELSERLVSRKIVLGLDDEGVTPPALEYSFVSKDRLLLSENGGEPVECAYGALELNHCILFSHMVPDTLRGYTVVLDTASGRAAVEEMWFIDYEGTDVEKLPRPLSIEDLAGLGFYVNREVERQIYRGCFTEEETDSSVDTGEVNAAGPLYTGDGSADYGSSFARSLRLDNKMVKWDDDLGRGRVFTYISNYFSTMVEVGTPDGEDVLTLPSDYLQIDDSTFFYDFGEVEYSGRLSVEVFDLFTMKKIGVTMGIGEDSRFEFRLYRADGKYLGQYATFYDFDDLGDKQPPFMAGRLGSMKGARCTYRTSVLSNAPTPDQVNALSSSVKQFEEVTTNGMVSETHMAYSRQCVGKKVTFLDDAGFRVELDFFEDEKLRFRTAERNWTEAKYRAFQLDADLVFLGFFIEGSCPPEGMEFALDFANGCATCIDIKIAGGQDPHDGVPVYHFGYMEAEGVPVPRTRRHGFTQELLGRSFTWSYSKGMTSQHIYNAPNSYSWTIFLGGRPGDPGYHAGGFVWSSPCTYIKLRKDVYIMSWVEEKWSGAFSSVAMNLRIMHDCGFGFSITHDASALHFHTISAYARDAGKCDLDGIYGV